MRWIILFLLVVTLNTAVQANENNCLDGQTNSQWAAMLSDNPQDHLVVKLVALRSGLCVMVEKDLVSLEMATTIFERERTEAIAQRRMEERTSDQTSGI